MVTRVRTKLLRVSLMNVLVSIGEVVKTLADISFILQWFREPSKYCQM